MERMITPLLDLIEVCFGTIPPATAEVFWGGGDLWLLVVLKASWNQVEFVGVREPTLTDYPFPRALSLKFGLIDLLRLISNAIFDRDATIIPLNEGNKIQYVGHRIKTT